jgi:hypothetical protein
LSIEEAVLRVGVVPFVLAFCDSEERPFDFSEGRALVVVVDWLPAIVPAMLAASAAVSFAS